MPRLWTSMNVAIRPAIIRELPVTRWHEQIGDATAADGILDVVRAPARAGLRLSGPPCVGHANRRRMDADRHAIENVAVQPQARRGYSEATHPLCPNAWHQTRLWVAAPAREKT